MPFKSKAQERWMRANHPDMAERWSAHTSKKQRAKMPDKINKGLFETPKPAPAAKPMKLAKPKLMQQSTPKLVPLKPQEPLKPKVANSIVKRDLRETKRSGAVGAAGGFIFGRGRLKPTLGWGSVGAAMGGGADIVRGRRRRVESELQVIKRDSERRRQQGAAMTGAGTVLAGTGLIGGGIPGVREPKKQYMFGHLRGTTAKEMRSRDNLGHNLKAGKSFPRAGILGFRASAHQNVTDDMKRMLPTKGAGKVSEYNEPSSNYLRGHLKGKIKEEERVLRGLRMARRATYPVTIGGGALAIAGARRKSQASKEPVGKRDQRERGAGAGAAGAAAGGSAGSYAGLRWGGDAGRALVNRRINNEWLKTTGRAVPKGMTVVGGDRFARRAKGVTRGVKGGVLLGTAGLGTAGYQVARGGEKVETAKRDNRQQSTAAGTALGTGTALAGVGHFVPKALDRQGKKFRREAISRVEEAQRLAPHFGGVKVVPGKKGPWDDGRWLRKPKKMMEPERGDSSLRNVGGANDIHGGPNSARAMRTGYLRGQAKQAKHFAEVFDSTSAAFRRARTPGLLLAAGGAGGVAASRNNGKRPVHKAYRPGDQLYRRERRVSPWRATEAIAGVTLATAGGSRLKMVGAGLRAGTRLSGNKKLPFERAQSVRNAAQRGTRQVGPTMRRNNTVSGAMDLIPGRLRPAAATVGGAAMIGHARPVTRDKYVPTNRRR